MNHWSWYKNQGNCDCLDCARQHAIDSAAKVAAPPIHNPSVASVTYNEEQAKVWTGLINKVYDEYERADCELALPMPTLLSYVAQEIPGLRAENWPTVTMQIRKLILDSPTLFEIRMGIRGGVVRKNSKFAAASSVVGSHAQTTAGSDRSVAIPVAMNNHTCPGCGNTKCSTDETSCWKCGGAL